MFLWFDVHNVRTMKLASFEALVAALENAGVRYRVAGALAVNAYGYLSIPTLIRMKQAADRPQDRIDIEHLRMRLEDDAGQ